MGTKMAVSFANIFMAEIETEIIGRSATKPLAWKRYIDDVFSLWNVSKNEIQTFIELANNYHATIKLNTIKSAIPQRQTNEWCRITCTPGSANYLK